MPIHKDNVGKIAERIVSNELDFRGFRVIDLNRDGMAANADLLAVSPTVTLQVQVKGSANTDSRFYWVSYGYCTRPIIDKCEPMFNRVSGFYKASHVVLVSVCSPNQYSCIVLPIDVAEAAAQLNLDRDYRSLTRDGKKEKKPNKVWIELEPRPKARAQTIMHCKKERCILNSYRDDKGWNRLLSST